jgi:hypothetical protein
MGFSKLFTMEANPRRPAGKLAWIENTEAIGKQQICVAKVCGDERGLSPVPSSRAAFQVRAEPLIEEKVGS